ncbi:MAG: hypothetical protein HY270_14755 [Deltaproteobacteria bacterium]|nr:hypothetical protein [Deltaproteobacteria bacterium]
MFCCEQSCARTPTPTPAFDGLGRRIFTTASGQFVLVVEGVAGASARAPGTSLQPSSSDNRPDLWIESTRPLGNGSTQVCDTGPPSAGGGGVPAVSPPSFSSGIQSVTDALNDFACRFDPSVGAAAPCTVLDSTREPRLINSSASVQFCDFVATTATFPLGDSVVSVALRDVAGNIGPTAQVVVHVVTPTPKP